MNCAALLPSNSLPSSLPPSLSLLVKHTYSLARSLSHPLKTPPIPPHPPPRAPSFRLGHPARSAMYAAGRWAAVLLYQAGPRAPHAPKPWVLQRAQARGLARRRGSFARGACRHPSSGPGGHRWQ